MLLVNLRGIRSVSRGAIRAVGRGVTVAARGAIRGTVWVGWGTVTPAIVATSIIGSIVLGMRGVVSGSHCSIATSLRGTRRYGCGLLLLLRCLCRNRWCLCC